MGFRVGSAVDPAGSMAALFGTWRVGSPERQEAAVDAIAAAWEARPWPGENLRSYGVLAGDDGTTLLHFSVLDGPDDMSGQAWKREVDAAVPGIERIGVVACRLRRGTPAYGDVRDARCAVLVTREFDPPAVGSANGLVDAMFNGSADTPPAAGLISAHFYVSLDGARVFNYALWTSAEAHQRAVGNVPPALAENEQWKQAHAWRGLRSTAFQRLSPRLHLARPAD
ncbi:hypothetical protein [Actinomadura napierensis]|uniref:Antibiotic biosynthesis monooxygenase n=1 Tax=Actinomadura napierensis TaxID=267854 RepID=A0ABN3AKX2_9ACTN